MNEPIDYKSNLEELFAIITELDAREGSGNLVIEKLQSFNWNELCDAAIEILEIIRE